MGQLFFVFVVGHVVATFICLYIVSPTQLCVGSSEKLVPAHDNNLDLLHEKCLH